MLDSEINAEDCLDKLLMEINIDTASSYIAITPVIEKYLGVKHFLTNNNSHVKLRNELHVLILKYEYASIFDNCIGQYYVVEPNWRKAKAAGGHYKFLMQDELWLMNTILKQLNTKGIGVSHHLDELSKETRIDDNNTVIVICKKIQDFKDCNYHPMSITITDHGKYRAEHGGYKKEDIFSYQLKLEQIMGDKIEVMTTGTGSPAVGKGVLSHEAKSNLESPESIELKTAQLRNTNLQSDLLSLQIKEAKNKKIIGFVAFIGGAVVTNLKDIWHLIKTLLHIGSF